MKCPKCQTENPEEKKYCRKCGASLSLTCPHCGVVVSADDEFCGECGQSLENETPQIAKSLRIADSERKYVTVLFSDLTGYTALSEKLDPEEVKEIMSRVFGEIAQVVTRYEGFIEKFIGDAVVAFFGVPKAHEDDAIRAIRAARDIHKLVAAMSPEVEKRAGNPIAMHSGINTGIVVTGEVNVEKGTHGLAGDTINFASRLSTLAKAGEIFVGPDTYRQAEGYYTFEAVEPTVIKGKEKPVQAFKVLSPEVKPTTIHRLSGLRSHLIGRKVELDALRESVDSLRKGKGRVFAICGDAGTGKSRLVEEFKNTLDVAEIQWLEGHAYAYSQNIPYFPLIDLLNRVFHLEEGDSPERVGVKIESGIEQLIGKKGNAVPYVGSLYSLSYPEVKDVSPEFWKSRLQEAIQTILTSLARKAPTIFFLEDLHWADPSFAELLRHALLEIRQPAIVLCAYRPPFSLFSTHQLSSIGNAYQEIRLEDLSLSDAQAMLESLLKTESLPSDLKRFVNDRAEGNPFYLEELINSLIEFGTLIRDNGSWKIERPITQSDISSTIHGLISGRLDRLDKETKRILQEASVIGRAFLYEILRRVTELGDRIDLGLSTLEKLDLIRTRSMHPDLEYMFKHPVTQEVVYNSLLKKDRLAIHEEIGLVTEQLFHNRLSEVYETLAFHFKQGRSSHKAIDYLMKSGEKSLKRYALKESHQFYTEAFELLTGKPEKTKEEEQLLIDVIIRWALVFYYRGDFKGLNDLLTAHEALAESLGDEARLGMFYGWRGFVQQCRGNPKDAQPYLLKALHIGEDIGNTQVIGYARTWLVWTCASLGLLDDAIIHGERAQEIAKLLESDHYLHFKSLGGLVHNWCLRGDTKKAWEAGKALVEYGEKYSDNRSLFMGHVEMGLSHYAAGDLESAIECAKNAISVSVDPFYAMGGKLVLTLCHVSSDQLKEAEDLIREILSFSEEFGCEVWGTPALALLGVVYIAKGQIKEGLKMIEDAQRSFAKNEARWWLAQSEYILGKIYLQMVEGARPVKLSTMARNIGFLVKKFPFAAKEAEAHFNRSIELANQIGAKGIVGEAYLDLGHLHRSKGRNDQAKACISKAIQMFEECGAEVFLRLAHESLASL
jgi:class 3 adenylate cyclase/tetratricopeptide (TPR) repeat protein